MISLGRFQSLIYKLTYQPSVFWKPEEIERSIRDSKQGTHELQAVFEERHLTDTHTYRLLVDLSKSLSGKSLDEVAFIQTFNNLLDVYKLFPVYEEHKDFFDTLISDTAHAKQKLLEYHVGLEVLAEKAQTLTPEDRQKQDQETLQTVGIFYILEYTVYLLWLLSQTSDMAQRRQLFFDGRKTAEANLPPYGVFADSFRRDLCLKIFDTPLRNSLLKAFFRFEEVVRTDDMQQICAAFREFNLALLQLFQQHGITRFKTVFLSPFGKDITMEEAVEKVDELRL